MTSRLSKMTTMARLKIPQGGLQNIVLCIWMDKDTDNIKINDNHTVDILQYI